jgi:SagB-type dehydrogenase family enzyme
LSASLLLSWQEGTTVSADGAGTLVVQGPGVRLSWRQIPAPILDALHRLAPPGLDPDRLGELIQGNGGILARCYYYLERLTQHGLLCYAAQADGTRLATLTAVSSSFTSAPARVVAGRRYVLSRFAYLRRQGNEAVLESPLAHARIVLGDCRAAALVAALAAPATLDELAGRVGSLEVDAVLGVLALLLRAGMLGEAGLAGADQSKTEEQAPDLQTWEFHDLLFHARTRRGRCDAAYGTTYRLADRLAPPPALKPVMEGPVHELVRPDLDRLERDDPPFARVQRQRRSIREFDGARPITDRQLGEFLFRVGRATGTRAEDVATPSGPVRQEFVGRPYPAGGGLYELELYVVVQACPPLSAGLYHYDPAGHRLIQLRQQTPEVVALLRDAAESTATPPDTLQVLLILTSRFARVAWKYESIAYALTLKHVGVLYQTMYLAATAMGLAPCAIGGGDADLFARAAGTEYCAETSVGEFLLGTPRPAGQVG